MKTILDFQLDQIFYTILFVFKKLTPLFQGKLQIEATQPEETEVLELPGTNLHKSEYPKQLLAKIEEAEAKNYYKTLTISSL